MAKVAIVNLTDQYNGTVASFTTDTEENALESPRYENTSGEKAIIIENLVGWSAEKADEVQVGWLYSYDNFYNNVPLE